MKLVMYILCAAVLVLSGLVGVEFRGATEARKTLERQATQSCKQQHATVGLLRLFLKEGSQQFERRPVSPGNLKRLQQFTKDTNILLDKADCPAKAGK